MGAINSWNHFNILENTEVCRFQRFVALDPVIREVINELDLGIEPALVQFWVCIPADSEENQCHLMLTDITRISTRNQGLEDYRKRCLENQYPPVGLDTKLGNWLAGRAAQTGIADHRTKHHVFDQIDRHSEDIGAKGQLVMPVLEDKGTCKIFAGILHFVTSVPKESYIDDFKRIHNLLKEHGLESKYMGKTIKLLFNGDIIRFTLPLSADLSDLHRKVTKRLPELEYQEFRVEYEDKEDNYLVISSDEDLQVCMHDSSSKGVKFIRMRVLLNA